MSTFPVISKFAKGLIFAPSEPLVILKVAVDVARLASVIGGFVSGGVKSMQLLSTHARGSVKSPMDMRCASKTCSPVTSNAAVNHFVSQTSTPPECDDLQIEHDYRVVQLN